MKTSTRILYLLFAYSATLGVLLVAGLPFMPWLTGPESGTDIETQKKLWTIYLALIAFLPIAAVLLTHRYWKKRLEDQ